MTCEDVHLQPRLMSGGIILNPLTSFERGHRLQLFHRGLVHGGHNAVRTGSRKERRGWMPNQLDAQWPPGSGDLSLSAPTGFEDENGHNLLLFREGYAAMGAACWANLENGLA